MKVGDVVPLDGPVDRDALRKAKLRRGAVARIAERKNNNAGTNTARRIVSDKQEQERRLGDPFERARLYLGKLGIPVFSAAVYNENFSERTAVMLIAKSEWVIDRQRVPDREAVIAFARAQGWAE